MPSRSIPILGGDLLAEMCEILGYGRSFATRLLALPRPDTNSWWSTISPPTGFVWRLDFLWQETAKLPSPAGVVGQTGMVPGGGAHRNPSTCGCGVFVRRCSTHSPTGRGSRNTRTAQPLAIEIPASSAARSNRNREQGPETRQGFAESYADSSSQETRLRIHSANWFAWSFPNV